jgi:hypothetical protein
VFTFPLAHVNDFAAEDAATGDLPPLLSRGQRFGGVEMATMGFDRPLSPVGQR